MLLDVAAGLLGWDGIPDLTEPVLKEALLAQLFRGVLAVAWNLFKQRDA
jgi:hypothetical protein